MDIPAHVKEILEPLKTIGITEWETKENPYPPFSSLRFRFTIWDTRVSLGWASGYGETLTTAARNFVGCFAHMLPRGEMAGEGGSS